MSSEVSDSFLKEESEAVEEATEEKVTEDAADGSEGEEMEEEEEEDEEDDDDKKEKSLIVEGKREKKKVERLSFEMVVTKKEPIIAEGKGQKLSDIERIEFFLKKKKCEELRLLHRLLFNRQGVVHLIKRNIGQFSGFSFEAGSDLYKKKEEMLLKKYKKSDLKNICGVLDLEKSGSNPDLVSRILKFLLEPKSTGKSLPKSKSKTPKGSKKERSRSSSARKSKSKKANVILTDESSSEDEKKDKESSEEEKESEEEEEEEEVDEPPKKIARKEKPKPKSTPKSKKATKPANVKKADSSTTKNAGTSKKEPVESESDSEDSSDDEPLIKKVKKPPTDDEIKETVKKLLAGANLEEVTMKQICKKVNESYPSDDLSSRKKFIKATVKELIS